MAWIKADIVYIISLYIIYNKITYNIIYNKKGNYGI